MKQKFLLLMLFILIMSCVGVLGPKIIINDSTDLTEVDINTVKRGARINYIDKPLAKLLVVEMKAYKNKSNNMSVDLYSYFGYKICNIEFLPNGSSHAEWHL